MAKRSIGATLSLNNGNFFVNMKSAVSASNNLKTTLGKTTNGMKGLGRQSVSTGGALTSFAKKAVGVVGAFAGFSAIKETISNAFGAAQKMENYRNTLNVVMKDTKKAAETMKWSTDFANSTPFETDDIVQATVRLESYGISAQNNMTRIGNMAGVMNKDVISAVEAIADAQTGELERLKEFGITKQMIVDKANQIMRGKEIVNQKGQITDQQNFNNALFALMDERFSGGMQKQANTWTGIWSTIKGVASSSMAQLVGVATDGSIRIGSPFDFIKNKMKSVSETLTQLSENGTIEKWSNNISSVMTSVGDGLGFVFDKAVDISNFITGNWGKIAPIIAGVAGAIGAYKLAVIGCTIAQKGMAIAQGIVTAAQWAMNVAMAANPIGLVVVAIGALIAVGVALWMNWDKLQAKFPKLINGIKTGISLVKLWFENAKNSFVASFNIAKALVIGGFNSIATVCSLCFNSIKNIATMGISDVKALFNGFFNHVKLVFTMFSQIIHGDWQGAWQSCKNIFSNVWNTIQQLLSSKVIYFKSQISLIKTSVSNTFNNIKTTISSAMESAKTAVKNAINSIKGFLNFSWQLPKIKLPHFKINGSFSLNPPSVPSFGVEWYKNGGIMTRPTMFGMNGTNAMVGGESGAEAILPLSMFWNKLRQFMTQKNQTNTKTTTTNTFYININAEGKSADEIVDDLVPKLKLALNNL